MTSDLEVLYSQIEEIEVAMMTTRRPDGHGVPGDGDPEASRRR